MAAELPTDSYRHIDAERVVDTIAALRARIEERFPNSGLSRVCQELQVTAAASGDRVVEIGRHNTGLRVGVGLVLLGCVWLITHVVALIDFSKTNADSVYSILQGIEATMNILVLMGAAALFLFTLEVRVKRSRALTAIHELRSLAHVIDMHQLPKDPGSTRPPTVATAPGRDAPQRPISAFELIRYLAYCSEMLSLTSKVAALYAQNFPDAVVADAVSDLERITTNLSQKIWQKITIVNDRMLHEDTAEKSRSGAPQSQASPLPTPPKTS